MPAVYPPSFTTQLLAEGYREQIGGSPIEHILVTFFDKAGTLLFTRKIADGTEDSCQTNWRDLFKEGWRAGAYSCVIAHNHPNAVHSGWLQPSKPDLRFTQSMRIMGAQLMVKVIDHVIVGPCPGYYSFKEGGRI